MTELYIDLLIVNDDLVLDAANIPQLISNRSSIGQDTVHMIRETGLLKETIAERSRLRRKDSTQQIEMLMDEDERLIPGTNQVIDEDQGNFLITGETIEFSKLEIGVKVD